MKSNKFAVMGASGQTGQVVASELLKNGEKVKVLCRNAESVSSLISSGAEHYPTDIKSLASLAKAFSDVDAVYIMNPPNYMVQDLLNDAIENTENIKKALLSAGVKKIVVLSSVGSHLTTGLGNIFTTRHLEQEMRSLAIDVSIVRAGWFMENWKSVAPVAKKDGILPSLLTPLDRSIEMTATKDIGMTAAKILQSANKNQLVELVGPAAVSPHSAAKCFSEALNRNVTAVPVASSDFSNVFNGLPPKVIDGWREMVEGFNSGHITFEGGDFSFIRGQTSMEEVSRKLSMDR